MRKAILAVTVIAALQGFAADASASDPATDMQGATEMASVTTNDQRTTLQQGRVQRSESQADKRTLETRTADSNSGRSKPVRVYFFFGGR
jgi:hypothetical protein